MKMMFHIDDFKCTLCANWFCPPFNLPYLLPCTHSICTSCLQKASSNDHIICPEDLESCPIQLININLTTKKALQRLMKEHKNYNQNTQLQCIKSLSIGFDQVLSSKEKQLRSLQALIDQIFHSEIDRLKHIHQKIKIDINRPYRVVEDWKQIVANHLTTIRKNHQNSDSRSSNMLQLNHYIQQGRKIKMQLNQFFQLEFDLFADRLMRMPRVCFDKDFTVNADTLQNKLKLKYNRQTLNNSNLSVSAKINTTADRLKTKEKQKQIQRQVNRQRQKRVLTCQSGSQNEIFDQIESSTMLITGQNRKNQISHRMPLQPIDTNIQKFLSSTNQNQNLLQNQQIPLQTKRGNNKQKSFIAKTPIGSQSQNLDRYIGIENQKGHKSNRSNFSQSMNNNSHNIHTKNTGKQNKQVSCRSKGKNQLTSPNRCMKGKQMPINMNNKGKNQPKLSNHINNGKNFPNDGLTEKKSQQFSLTQFQLQTLNNQNDLLIKDHSKVSTVSNKQVNMVSPNRTKSKKIIEKQSPPSLAFSGQFGQQQRMNKLAHMLDNTSSHASNNNSQYNSQRNSSKNLQKNYLQVQNTQPNIHQMSYQTNSLLMSPNTIRQQYTEQAQSQIPYEEEQLLNNDDMLITDNETGWQLGNINFLRQWKLKSQNNIQQPLQIRQNTYYYNCEKQKLSYMRKMQIHRVQQALKLTLVKDNFIQLINQSLHDVDMALYLQQFDWKHSNIEIVKFVKTSMSDQQLNILLNFLVKSSVKALVLSGNNLTDLCLDAFLNFVTMNNVLKNVYLPKNYVNILKSKSKINLLKQKGINIYI